ncbi:MAG: hypothetical protein ACREUQ_16105 [Burkholderiales bacterium]
MRPTVALLLVLGIILGPVYYAYCIYLSGKTAQTIPMTERGRRWVLPDGEIVRFSSGLGYKPVVLELRPVLNMVALRINFEFPEGSGSSGTAELQYQATLVQFGHTNLERPILLRITRRGTQTVDLGPFEIYYPGAYVFLLEEAGKRTVTPVVTLEVVQKIEKPNMPVAWTGIALLIVGLVLQLHALWLSHKRISPRG